MLLFMLVSDFYFILFLFLFKSIFSWYYGSDFLSFPEELGLLVYN